MSKHKKSSHSKKRKSSKCPEPFNTMIGLAGSFALAAIADNQEKKHHYSERGKINPYAASAIGVGTGKLNKTEDIIRMGALLGAMGSFDDAAAGADDGLASVIAAENVYDDIIADDIEEEYDPIFSEMNFTHTNDNRYAWRLNCEDGSFYGIDPEDYETREEYNEALYKEKYSWRDFCEDGADYGITPEDYETEDEYDEALERAREEEEESDYINFEIESEIVPEIDDEENEEVDFIDMKEDSEPAELDPFVDDDFHIYVYCRVKLQTLDEPVYYRTEDHSLRRGDQVIVREPDSGENVIGEIVSVENHMSFSVPAPVEETKVIISKI